MKLDARNEKSATEPNPGESSATTAIYEPQPLIKRIVVVCIFCAGNTLLVCKFHKKMCFLSYF